MNTCKSKYCVIGSRNRANKKKKIPIPAIPCIVKNKKRPKNEVLRVCEREGAGAVESETEMELESDRQGKNTDRNGNS